jgi:hypothetical protein
MIYTASLLLRTGMAALNLYVLIRLLNENSYSFHANLNKNKGRGTHLNKNKGRGARIMKLKTLISIISFTTFITTTLIGDLVSHLFYATLIQISIMH